MNSLLLIILILLGGAILAYLAKRINPMLSSIVSFLAISSAAVVFFTMTSSSDVVTVNVRNFTLQFGLNAYSWVFAAMVMGISTLVSLYNISYMSGKDRLGYFNLNFTLAIMSMMGIVFANDWISFFIFW